MAIPDPSPEHNRWNSFSFTVPVEPATTVYLYVVVYNNNESPTGLRVEFVLGYLTPE